MDADKFMLALSQAQLKIHDYQDLPAHGAEYDVVIWAGAQLGVAVSSEVWPSLTAEALQCCADHHLWNHVHRDAGPALLLDAGFQGQLW